MCDYCLAPLGKYGVGLDRINNSKGYTIDNIVPCCGNCNKLKNNILTRFEMVKVVKMLKISRGEGIWLDSE